MKEKHLQEIVKLRAWHMDQGKKSEPVLAHFLKLSIARGNNLPLLSSAAICDAVRQDMAGYTSGCKLELNEVFKSCPEFQTAHALWKEAESLRQRRVREYKHATEALMRQAQFDEGITPEVVAAGLLKAAREFHLVEQ